jgi:hypothetical protein
MFEALLYNDVKRLRKSVVYTVKPQIFKFILKALKSNKTLTSLVNSAAMKIMEMFRGTQVLLHFFLFLFFLELKL